MPRRYILRNPRRKRSAGETVLGFLMSRGGSATKYEISRHSADGKLLAQATPQLGDLIVSEQSRGKRSKRPCERISLTLKGLAAAQALRPEWQPRRLATDVLKQWFDELVSERNPWAMGLLRDADDALNWRAHEARIKRGELVCEPPRSKRRPRGRPYIAQGVLGPSTLETQGKPVAPSHQAFGTVPEPYKVTECQIIGLPAEQSKPVCHRCQYCEHCHMDAEFCQCGLNHVCGRARITPPSHYRGNTPTPPTAQESADPELAAKIKAAGFQVNSTGEVLYGGKWITPERWCELMPHVKV